ncbi:integrase core domain-containing protein, partial [Escherichia coli]|uniref:integrase core domain-containing protein n=1 Tax=Escherichia coli TaxID=562 RepID=UPI001F178CBF
YLPGSLQGKISSDGCLKKEQMVVSAIASTPHNLVVAIEHYNENHPHSALSYRSPREYRRQQVMLT